MSNLPLTASAITSGGDDFVYVGRLPDSTIVAILADGATGVGNGRFAAEKFIQVCRDGASSFEYPDAYYQALFKQADTDIGALNMDCDTTGILFLVKDTQYICLTTGDSEVWMLSDAGVIHISNGQFRKARMGSWIPTPEVKRGNITGPILIASDGLEYAMRLPIALDILRSASTSPAQLIMDKARELRPNGLPDDLSVITIS